jgi:hypothetical protein
MIKIIVVLLFPLMAFGQMAEWKKAEFYDPFDYNPVPCPWQSWRLIPNVSISIDLIADSTARAVLMQEPWLFAEDLLDVYHGYPFGFERLELISRWSSSPGKYRVQIPGLIAPYERYWLAVNPNEALDLSKNPYFGWTYTILPGNIALAEKKLPDGTYHISSAMFLRAVDPNYYVATMMSNYFLMPIK